MAPTEKTRNPLPGGNGVSIGRFACTVTFETHHGGGRKKIETLEAEPSGLAVVDGTVYCVSDDGKIGWRNESGDWLWMTLGALPGQSHRWTDLEAVTTVPSQRGFLYLGVENGNYTDSAGVEHTSPIVLEIPIKDLVPGGILMPASRWWPLALSTHADNSGMEALTFVPDGQHPHTPSRGGFGGYFYAVTDEVRAFDLFLNVESDGTRTPRTGGSGTHTSVAVDWEPGKIAEICNDGGDLWTLRDDDAGDASFPYLPDSPRKGNPLDDVYEKACHDDPSTGGQKLRVWRFNEAGTYKVLQTWHPPKVACEALAFDGRNLLIGYDQSDRQGYRNDWQALWDEETDKAKIAARARLSQDDIWCEKYFVEADDKQVLAARKPLKFYNYVRKHESFLPRRNWEVRWVETETLQIPWKTDDELAQDRSLWIAWPKSVPQGYSWLGQIVQAQAFTANPMAPVVRWLGPENPLVGVAVGRYLWNDRSSGGGRNVRVWELVPLGDAGSTRFGALGVYFELIGSSEAGIGGYGAPAPDPAVFGSLAAVSTEYLAAPEAAEKIKIWSDDGIGADGRADFKRKKGENPLIPEWKDLTLFQTKSPFPEPWTRTAFAAQGASPLLVPNLRSLRLQQNYE